MKVLITGGAGFIGSHLAEYHLDKGDMVYALDDLSGGSLSNISPFFSRPEFQYDCVDVVSWEELPEAVAWADRIYHMAAVVGVFRVISEPLRTLVVNVEACRRVLDVASRVNPKSEILIASSSEVYGLRPARENNSSARSIATDCLVEHIAQSGKACYLEKARYASTSDNGVLREVMSVYAGNHRQLRWNYAVSKLVNEALGLSYVQNFGINVTVARIFNTIGPRQTGRYGMVVPRFVEQAVNQKPITVFGDGSQTRCFCDVRDLVVALDRLAGSPSARGEVANVGNDREISIRDLAELVKERAESSSPIVMVPHEEVYGEEGELFPRRKPCLDKLYALTGFRPLWRLEDTLDDLIWRARRAH